MTENNPLYYLLVIGIIFLGVVVIPTIATQTVQAAAPVIKQWGFDCGFSVDACAFMGCWLQGSGQQVACPGGGQGYKKV